MSISGFDDTHFFENGHFIRIGHLRYILPILAGPSPAGGWGSGARPPHFTFGPPVAAYIQYCIFKMWPPLLVFGPSFWFLAPPCCYILAMGLNLKSTVA